MYKMRIWKKYYLFRQKYDKYNNKSYITLMLYVILCWYYIVHKHIIGKTIKGAFWCEFIINKLRTPCSGLVQILTLTGYSSVLTWFTWNRSIYNSIPISITTIRWNLLLLLCFVLTADIKRQFFGCSVVLLELSLIVIRIKP